MLAEYQIDVSRSARKELQRLSSSIAARVLKHIETLSATPRPPGCVKLEGSTDLWRIRVGEYRVVYRIDDAKRVVDVSVVRHRREAYK